MLVGPKSFYLTDIILVKRFCKSFLKGFSDCYSRNHTLRPLAILSRIVVVSRPKDYLSLSLGAWAALDFLNRHFKFPRIDHFNIFLKPAACLLEALVHRLVAWL